MMCFGLVMLKGSCRFRWHHTWNDKDFVAWRFAKNHMFSVRSTYSMWSGIISLPDGTTVGRGTILGISYWAKLWGSKVPAKIKIHAWKVLHGFLPCLVVFANRHIATSSNCPMCAGGCEDIMHTLFTCPRGEGSQNLEMFEARRFC